MRVLNLIFFQTLAEGDDKDCFCGGIIKYFEMLTSVEALHCSSSHHGSSMFASSQGHVTNDLSFSEQYCKTANLRQTMGRATYDLFCKDVKTDQECVGVTLEDFTSVSNQKVCTDILTLSNFRVTLMFKGIVSVEE